MRRCGLSIFAFLLLIVGPTARASDVLEKAVLRARDDVRASTKELATLRATHARERAPVAEELTQLERDVVALRAEAARLTARQQKRERRREELAAEVHRLDAECRFVFSLLSEYRRSTEVRSSRAGAVRYSDAFGRVDAVLTEAENFQKMPEAAHVLLDLAVQRNRDRLGGTSFEGVALDPDGIEHAGRFAECGPLAYFADDEGLISGLVVARLKSSAASVHVVPDASSSIRSLVMGSEATVPVDVSAGDALKVAAARKGLLEHLEAGGVVMVPLLVIALWALVLVVLKWHQLGRERVPGRMASDRILAALSGGDDAGARVLAQGIAEPLGPVLVEALDHCSARREHIEEILHERILMVVPRLEKHLGTLAVFGGVAPLLGLLGTVTGMMHTFQLVTVFGTGEAKLLSGGISEALVTTQVGLAIAIPVLLVHAYLVRRVRGLVADVEQAAAEFVERLKADTPS